MRDAYVARVKGIIASAATMACVCQGDAASLPVAVRSSCVHHVVNRAYGVRSSLLSACRHLARAELEIHYAGDINLAYGPACMEAIHFFLLGMRDSALTDSDSDG